MDCGSAVRCAIPAIRTSGYDKAPKSGPCYFWVWKIHLPGGIALLLLRIISALIIPPDRSLPAPSGDAQAAIISALIIAPGLAEYLVRSCRFMAAAAP